MQSRGNFAIFSGNRFGHKGSVLSEVNGFKGNLQSLVYWVHRWWTRI